MSKRISTRKVIQRKLYVGEATEYKPSPRKEVVQDVLTVLQKPQFKRLQKHIEKISIIKTVASTKYVVVGEIKDGKKLKRLYIYDNSHIPIPQYARTAVHELAHIDWNVKQKWHNEAWTKFNEIAKELRPVNEYLQRKGENWKKDVRYIGGTHYENEMHSAAAELYYYGTEVGGHYWSFPSDQQILVDAYAELHGLPKIDLKARNG